MLEGANPQAANLLRESGSQSQVRGNAQENSGQGQLRQDSAGQAGGARPVQDVSVQISQQGLESAASVSGQAVSDASATDTNTATSVQQAGAAQANDNAENTNSQPHKDRIPTPERPGEGGVGMHYHECSITESSYSA